MLTITVNGQTQTLEPGRTVADLIASLGLAGKRIAVEVNGAIVPRSLHASTTLGSGDRIEMVVAVGGG